MKANMKIFDTDSSSTPTIKAENPKSTDATKIDLDPGDHRCKPRLAPTIDAGTEDLVQGTRRRSIPDLKYEPRLHLLPLRTRRTSAPFRKV
jgi:hypothetical protein